MSATVSSKELNGVAPGVPTTVSNIYHQTSDQAASDETNLLLRPISGTKYGFWKSLYLNCEAAPVTGINNVYIYSDGTISWVGVTCFIGDETPLIANYQIAGGVVGSTGYHMLDVSNGHAGISAETNVESIPEGSKKSVTGSIEDDTGPISNLIIVQVKVATDAESGILSSEKLTWVYDEF